MLLRNCFVHKDPSGMLHMYQSPNNGLKGDWLKVNAVKEQHGVTVKFSVSNNFCVPNIEFIAIKFAFN